MTIDKRMLKAYIDIHEAIHDKNADSVKVGNLRLKINKGTLRSVAYDGFTFTEQNPNKQSAFAQAARAGAMITWGICDGQWLYIDDQVAREFTGQQEAALKRITG